MKIACIGNSTIDFTVSKDEFITEGARCNYNNITYNVGGPANTAASVIRKFGNNVDFYGQVGNDNNGMCIINKLKEEKINIDNLNIKENFNTPFSFIIISTKNNSRTICSVRDPKDFEKATIDKINYGKDYNYILTDGKYYKESLYLLKSNPNAISIIDAGRVNNNVIELCKVVTYIICSEDFANEITGITINDDLENNKKVFIALKRIFKDSKEIVITIGKNGYIFEDNNEIKSNYSFSNGKPAIDTNGAGDIFHGAFTYALANNYSFIESLEFANITASLSTTKTGGRDSCPSLDEVKKNMNSKTYKKKFQ